jgi:hypothetical protein
VSLRLYFKNSLKQRALVGNKFITAMKQTLNIVCFPLKVWLYKVKNPSQGIKKRAKRKSLLACGDATEEYKIKLTMIVKANMLLS